MTPDKTIKEPWENVKWGKPRKFKNPDELWAKAIEYFAWVDENPFKEERVAGSKEGPRLIDVSKRRPYTEAAFCMYANIGTSTFDDYQNREEYSGVTKEVKKIIRNQKFEGATAGFFNANIIARDLGLADKTESKVEVKSHEEALKELGDD